MVTKDEARPTVSARLQLLSRISLAINSTSQLDDLFESIHQQVHAVVPLSEFCIGRYAEETDHVEWLFATPNGQSLTSASASRPDAATKEAILRRTLLDKRDEAGSPGLTEVGGEIVVPLLLQNEIVGVMRACSAAGTVFSPDDSSCFAVLACHLAQVLQRTFGEEATAHPEHVGRYESIEKKNKKLISIIEIARSIAHEFNQPLTGISGYCTLIKEELDDGPERIFEDISEIQKQSARLEELVFKFQNIAHVEYLERVDRIE